jgi:hypothetical protein
MIWAIIKMMLKNIKIEKSKAIGIVEGLDVDGDNYIDVIEVLRACRGFWIKEGKD